MKTTKKIINQITIFLLTLTMMISSFTFIQAYAADEISLADNMQVSVEYGETYEVTAGTVRYASQSRRSPLFRNGYWGDYVHISGQECFTSSISMSLSAIGINLTPAQLGDYWRAKYPNSTDVFNTVPGDAVGHSCDHPDFHEAYERFKSDAGYSPIIIKLEEYSWSHFVVVLGKNDAGEYLILDPAADSIWNMRISRIQDGRYELTYVHPSNGRTIKETHHLYTTQYFNPTASGCFSKAQIPDAVKPLNATATVTYNKAVLREGPSQDYPVVRKAKVNEELEIVGFTINHHNHRWLFTKEGNYIYDERVDLNYKTATKGYNLNLLTGDHGYGRIYVIGGRVTTGDNGGTLKVRILQNGQEVLESHVDMPANSSIDLAGSHIDKQLVYNKLARGSYTTVLDFIESFDTGKDCRIMTTCLFEGSFNIR